MPIVPVTLNNKSAPSRYRQGGDAHLINCYVEQIGDEGKVPWAIYSSDGLQEWVQLPDADGGIRASLYVDGTLYVVAGTRLYSINATTKLITLINTLNIGGDRSTLPVYMERNRRFATVNGASVSSPDIMIVCDGLGYYYRTETNTFGLISDAGLYAPQSLTFNNGYFVISTADNRYQSGELDDVLNWNANSFAVADADPDKIIRVAQYQGDVVVFGEFSTQFARDVGSSPMPFENVQSNDLGLYAPNSVATVEQTLAFVAVDRSVRILEGYNARKISTHSVDRDLEAITDPNEIIASTWVSAGHTFYCLSSLSWTWVYDTVTGLWHERKSYGSERWNISNVAYTGDKIIAGDRTSGVLYEMSSAFADDAGETIISQIVLPPVHAFPNPLTFNSVYIDAQVGVGTGQGETSDIDPYLMLEWSTDGGDTFKGSRQLALGAQGKTTQRVRAWRLGQSKEDGYTFRISWSANVARALYGMAADVEKDAA